MTKKKPGQKEAPETTERAVTPKAPVKRKRAAKSAAPDGDKQADDSEAPDANTRADIAEPPVPVVRTREQHRLALKRKVRMMYDLQRLRLQAGGRTLKRPTKPDSEERVEIFLHEVDLAILETRTKELLKVEKAALRDVQEHLETLPFYQNVLSDKVRYRGIGPTMAGVIMSEFDIYRSDTVSKMWSFAGLISKPAFRCKKCFALLTEDADGQGRRAQLELERQTAVKIVTEKRAKLAGIESGEVEPEDGATIDQARATALAEFDLAIGVASRLKNEVERVALGTFVHRGGKVPKGCKDPVSRDETKSSGEAQRPTKGVKLPYNAFLRVKLVGVLGPVLIKSGSPWRKVYDDRKLRTQSMGWGKNDGHRHQDAIRYMIKYLLMDIHSKWREHEGLLVREPYSVEKLGMAPHSSEPVKIPKPARSREDMDDETDGEESYVDDIAAELEQLEATE
jgi:hypothetical protein